MTCSPTEVKFPYICFSEIAEMLLFGIYQSYHYVLEIEEVEVIGLMQAFPNQV